jgi:hypothetical protein
MQVEVGAPASPIGDSTARRLGHEGFDVVAS